MATLAETLETIRTEIKTRLEEADLARNVIWGDRSRVGNLKPPAIWVFPDEAMITHDGSALAEEWRYTFVVAALVKDTDPEAGAAAAEDLVAKASAALIAGRTLSGTVRDMVRTRFIPGYANEVATASQLHWAGIAMEARFRYREEVN